RLKRHRIAPRARQLVNSRRDVAVNTNEQATKRHGAPLYFRRRPMENVARAFSASSSARGEKVSFRATRLFPTFSNQTQQTASSCSVAVFPTCSTVITGPPEFTAGLEFGRVHSRCSFFAGV